MALWRIKYDDWQMECCGEPFSVGDEVRWQPAPRGPDDLAAETHGPGPDDAPETVGTVRSIQVVTEGYAATRPGSRTYEPVAGERWLRTVGTCPERFSGEDRPDRAGRGYRRSETGVLAVLETPGGGQASPSPGQ